MDIAQDLHVKYRYNLVEANSVTIGMAGILVRDIVHARTLRFRMLVDTVPESRGVTESVGNSF